MQHTLGQRVDLICSDTAFEQLAGYRDQDGELCPLAQHTAGTDLTVMQLNQLPGYGKTQARSAIHA